MTFDPNVLTWKDWVMVGVIVGLWLANRGRRVQGERIGALEKALARVLGIDDRGKHQKP